MRILAILGLALTLGGCPAHQLGYGGQHPGRFSVDCGDGASFQIQGNIAALAYGTNNSASVQCKGKALIEQGPPTAPAPGGKP